MIYLNHLGTTHPDKAIFINNNVLSLYNKASIGFHCIICNISSINRLYKKPNSGLTVGFISSNPTLSGYAKI